MKRTKKSELLIGVMIGLYGSWIMGLLGKLNQANSVQVSLFGFSFLPFLWYFQEIFTILENQKFVLHLPLKMFLGTIYFLIILVLLSYSGLMGSELLFSWTGLLFWVMLMMVERREVAQ
jgi:hypothetical protein